MYSYSLEGQNELLQFLKVSETESASFSQLNMNLRGQKILLNQEIVTQWFWPPKVDRYGDPQSFFLVQTWHLGIWEAIRPEWSFPKKNGKSNVRSGLPRGCSKQKRLCMKFGLLNQDVLLIDS